MKIYLLNAPFKENFVRCGRWQGVAARGGTMYYPIWLSYAAGLLENEGHIVRLVDAIARKWQLDKVIGDVQDFKPDMIVVDSNFSSLTNDINIINEIKASSNAMSILVGPPASQFPADILDKGVDIVARFEYDFTLCELATSIENENGFENVKGISYKENERYIHNPNREFTSSEDLNCLPFVTRIYKKHLNIKDYFLNHSLYPMVQIFTGRGCPNRCTFCSWPETLMGRKYRARDVENIILEFDFIKNNLPEVREVFIEDDTFTINKKRVMKFCDRMKNEKIDISWSCQSRADLDLETLKAMKKAGCRLLDVGFESGNNNILTNIKKGVNVDQLLGFSRNIKKAKLKLLADFVIGFPGETRKTAEQTINLINQMKPDLLQVAVATPIPGTEFYTWANENGFILVSDLEKSLDSNGFQKCIISYPDFSSQDIEYYVDRILKDYYLSPSYIPIALKNVAGKNGIHELNGLIKSAKTFILYMKRN